MICFKCKKSLNDREIEQMHDWEANKDEHLTCYDCFMKDFNNEELRNKIRQGYLDESSYISRFER